MTSCLLVLVSCGAEKRTLARKSAPAALAVSIAYADAHFPKGTFQPGGADLRYDVEDHGDIWITEIGPQGYMGGGLRLIVRKSDMAVVDAQQTQ